MVLLACDLYRSAVDRWRHERSPDTFSINYPGKIDDISSRNQVVKRNVVRCMIIRVRLHLFPFCTTVRKL